MFTVVSKQQAIETREKAVLSDETVSRVLEYWKNKGPKYRRTYLFFKVLANTGARRSEALGFFSSDLQILKKTNNWVLLFRRQRTAKSKTSQEAFDTRLKTPRSYGFALLPQDLGKELIQFIEDYNIGEDEPIFDRGRAWANKVWIQTKKALGLDPRLRIHSFITYYIRKQAPSLFAKVQNRELDAWDVEDLLRKDSKTIARHYHRPRPPEEVAELLGEQEP